MVGVSLRVAVFGAAGRMGAEVCRAVFRELKGDPAIREQAACDEAALFGPTLGLKAMTTMRLLGDVTHYTFSAAANALAEAEGSARR